MRSRRRRCVVCGELFRADPRVGKRQRACGGRECQVERRRRTQAHWRAANPEYDRDRRLRARLVAAEDCRPRRAATPPPARAPDVLRVSPALRCLPWELIQAELGVAAADFLAILACLVLRLAQDQRSAQTIDSS